MRPKKEPPIPNHHRGEIEGILDGTPHTLCLTLGALAQLEATFGDENMLALAQRFEGGKLSARDCVRIIGAGLRGAGHPLSDDAVAHMKADGGVAGFIDIVARLLTITFGAAPSPRPQRGEGRGEGRQRVHDELERQPSIEALAPSEVPAPVPFPGMR